MYKIYGKENCVYCDRAKSLLTNKKLDFTYFDIVQDFSKKQELLDVVPEVRTVPQIFLNGTHIGGYTELLKTFQ